MGPSTVLALESAAHGEGKGIRRGEEYLDALAYIDFYDNAGKSSAEALIKEEMKRMDGKPANYLSELPKLHVVKFPGHPLLQAELDRVKAEQAMPGMDKSRLRCEPPPENRKNDVSAWHAALDNAHSQLEHQYNRLQNMELLLEYGAKSWQAHIRSLEITSSRLESEAKELKDQEDALNQKRALKHKAVGKELSEIKQEWKSLINKNVDITKAIAALDAEIAQLQGKLPESEKQADQTGTEDTVMTEASA